MGAVFTDFSVKKNQSWFSVRRNLHIERIVIRIIIVLSSFCKYAGATSIIYRFGAQYSDRNGFCCFVIFHSKLDFFPWQWKILLLTCRVFKMQALTWKTVCQMMIGVYNHLRNERYLGSITILSDWIPRVCVKFTQTLQDRHLRKWWLNCPLWEISRLLGWPIGSQPIYTPGLPSWYPQKIRV